MILYHGTSEYAAREALKRGLRPRGETGEDNWTELGIGSNPRAIYLTDTYACHYAINARQAGTRFRTPDGKLSKRIAVIEIETRGLPFTNFRSDEDYMAFTDPSLQGLMTEENIKAKIRHHANNLGTDWKQCLATLGTCVYLGRIHAKHITRVAFFDPKANDAMAWAMADGSLTPEAFKFAGKYHRSYIKWLFGEPVTTDDVISLPPATDEESIWNEKRKYWDDVIANRDGIEIIEGGQ